MKKKYEEPKLVLSILMPVFNEGVNLERTLKFLRSSINVSHEVLIIYDFQEDDSIPIAKKIKKDYSEIKLIHNTFGKGVANAIKAGIKEALGEFSLILTADDPGPIFSIDEIMAQLYKKCEFISCTRYAHGGKVFGGSFIGRQISRLANKLFFVFGPRTFTDSTVGYKAFKTPLFKNIEIEAQKGWSVGFELAIKSQMHKMKIGEVPILSMNRFFGGESSFSLGSWLVEYLRWFFFGLRNLRDNKSRNFKVMRSKSNF